MTIRFGDLEEALVESDYTYASSNHATASKGVIKYDRLGNNQYVMFIQSPASTSSALESEPGLPNNPLAANPVADYVFDLTNVYRWFDDNKIQISAVFKKAYQRPWQRG